MKIRPIITIFAGLLFTEAGAASPVVKGEAFTDVRKRLFALGWRGDEFSHAGPGEYVGVERELLQKEVTEVDYCSGGKSFCVLQYIKGKGCLRLYTQDEHLHLMRVDGWSNDCRERFPDEPSNPLPNDVRYLLQWYQHCQEFGQCAGLDTYLKRIRAKYKNNEEVMKRLAVVQLERASAYPHPMKMTPTHANCAK